MPPKKSWVWDHWDRIAGGKVRCKHCGEERECKDSTSGLSYHTKFVHKVDPATSAVAQVAGQKRQRTLNQCEAAAARKEQLTKAELNAVLWARGGLSFRTLDDPLFRELYGSCIPVGLTRKTMSQEVVKVAEKWRGELAAVLRGKLVTIGLDGWTNTRHKKMVNFVILNRQEAWFWQSRKVVHEDAVTLARELTSCFDDLTERGIKVIGVVADNASAMQNALSDFGALHPHSDFGALHPISEHCIRFRSTARAGPEGPGCGAAGACETCKNAVVEPDIRFAADETPLRRDQQLDGVGAAQRSYLGEGGAHPRNHDSILEGFRRPRDCGVQYPHHARSV
jgi:hypothetical protein